ncbi:MAG: metal ABC transporter substrate-binding protein [Acidobacteriota bacterium]
MGNLSQPPVVPIRSVAAAPLSTPGAVPRLLLGVFLTLAAAALVACGGGPDDAAPNTDGGGTPAAEDPAVSDAVAPAVRVVATNVHTAWLADRIGGDPVAVESLMPAGADPGSFIPEPERIVELASPEVDLVLAHGADYETWMQIASLPEDKVHTLTDGLDLLVLHGRTHSHGPGGEHSHVGQDPRTFTDPALVAEQGRAVLALLTAAAPPLAAELDARGTALQGELTALAEAFAAVGEGIAAAPIRLAQNHPSFHYLARRLGAPIETFDLNPNRPPADSEVAAVAAWIDGAGGRHALLWDRTPAPEVVSALPETLEHRTLDPLDGSTGGDYDYLGQARANLQTLQKLVDGGP